MKRKPYGQCYQQDDNNWTHNVWWRSGYCVRAGGSSAIRKLRNDKSVVGSCPCKLTTPGFARYPRLALSFGGRLSVKSLTWSPLIQTARCGPWATIVLVNQSPSEETTLRA